MNVFCLDFRNIFFVPNAGQVRISKRAQIASRVMKQMQFHIDSKTVLLEAIKTWCGFWISRLHFKMVVYVITASEL